MEASWAVAGKHWKPCVHQAREPQPVGADRRGQGLKEAQDWRTAICLSVWRHHYKVFCWKFLLKCLGKKNVYIVVVHRKLRQWLKPGKAKHYVMARNWSVDLRKKGKIWFEPSWGLWHWKSVSESMGSMGTAPPVRSQGTVMSVLRQRVVHQMTDYWQFTQSRSQSHHGPLQDQEGMLSFKELSCWCWKNVALYGWAGISAHGGLADA